MKQFTIKIISAMAIDGTNDVMPIQERNKYTRVISAPDYQTALEEYRKQFEGKVPKQYQCKLEITDNEGNEYERTYW